MRRNVRKILIELKLCITEKPSVGRDIARILGATKKEDGYFEGNGYWVTWTFGHLCTLKEPHDYCENWKMWSLSSLPMIPPRFGIKVINDSGTIHQFKVIENLISKCDEIINCGDAGQEGEVIQRWVMQKAGCNKPVYRLWISSLTDSAIIDGFENLKPQKELDSLYSAGLCRAIGDWVLGINATRLYTLKYGERGKIISVGRVQTPTLALIVKRQKEIESFVPSDTWEVRTLYRDVTFIYDHEPFKTNSEAEETVEKIKTAPLAIKDIIKKKGNETPPRLWDLTSLQVECNRKFSMTADTTLKTIQSLYEKKLTTYPRVDTTYLTEDLYKKCPEILNSLKDKYSDLLQPLRGSKLRKSKKVFDDSKVTDHHAIIPTGQRAGDLTEDERNVYDTVARRFIASFYPNCEFEQTTVIADVSGFRFKTGGKVILNPGWRFVYNNTKSDTTKDDSDDSPCLAAFELNESGSHEPMVAKKTSQPPKYYTEGTLLKAMETAGNMVEDETLRESLKANGIGRPSTRAAIIEILFKRGYIERVKKSIRATSSGIELIDIIQEKLLTSAELTGIWENRLRRIERDEYNAATFISQIKELINEITLSVLRDNSKRRIISETYIADKKRQKSKKTKQ